MSRLLKYLQPSGLDEDTNKFRALNIKLSEQKTNYDDIVKDTEDKYALNDNILEDINILNKELKKIYGGKLLFQLCLTEGKSLNDINTNKRIKKRMQRFFVDINERFSDIKFNLERKIANK
jgi:hypothetical protein